MNVISKEDLQIVLDNCFADDYVFDIDDFDDLIKKYGEEWFVEDGQLSLVNESKSMKKLKEKAGMK